MERNKWNITKSSGMKYNYNITEDPPKNAPFTEDEILKFIGSAESFRSMPYLDSEGHITVGYGKLLQKQPKEWTIEQKEQGLKNYTEQFKKTYPTGISKEEAYETLKTSYNTNWKYMEDAIKKEGINVDKIPQDIKIALKLFSYGGIGHANDADGAIKYLKTAEEQGYNETARKELAGKIYREKEHDGVSTRISLYRAMIEGKYDYDSDRKNLETDKWNVYSNKDKYKEYTYENYSYANSKVQKKENTEEQNKEKETNKSSEYTGYKFEYTTDIKKPKPKVGEKKLDINYYF